MLVDDEEMVLEVGGRLLEHIGYNVIAARDGVEACQLYEKDHGGIDLVVLDMMMPNRGGGETFDIMKQINPDARVILSSGYSKDGPAQQILERGCKGFIQKPYTLDSLKAKIAEVYADADQRQ